MLSSFLNQNDDKHDVNECLINFEIIYHMIMTIEKGYEPLLFSVSFWERSRFFLLTFDFAKHGNFGGLEGATAVFIGVS